MDKLAPWSRRLARALIAGLLAWALVAEGAASSVFARGVDLAGGASDVDRCSAPAGDRGHAPGGGVPCSCCLPCRASTTLDLFGFSPAPQPGHYSSHPAVAMRRTPAGSGLPAVPPGWTSSWSQRAPPLL